MANEANRIIRNNVNAPIIVSEDKYYKIESINQRNLNKIGILEQYSIPFACNLEDDDNSQLKCVLRVDDKYGEMVDDLSVVCHVALVERMKYDYIRDYNVHLFRQSVLETINRLSCEYVGVVIVAQWKEGDGSDAMTLPLYTAADFHREFPDAEFSQILDFYKGKGDGFVVREWKDDNGREVEDKVFYVSDTQRLKEINEKAGINDKIEIYIDDCDMFLEISMNIRHFSSLRKDK